MIKTKEEIILQHFYYVQFQKSKSWKNKNNNWKIGWKKTNSKVNMMSMISLVLVKWIKIAFNPLTL